VDRDRLFLLAPGFADGDRREYCPECAELWGVLSYFPAIKESVNVVYQDLVRPRAELVEMLGEQNQNCPTLVLSSLSPNFDGCGIQKINGHYFIDNARDMGSYFAKRFGTPFPRGS